MEITILSYGGIVVSKKDLDDLCKYLVVSYLSVEREALPDKLYLLYKENFLSSLYPKIWYFTSNLFMTIFYKYLGICNSL